MLNAPKFSIEKPCPISINSPLLNEIDNNGEWLSQLKIDEHRSFFIFNGKSLTVLGWRGNVHHTATLTKSYPPMVLDGGIIKTKTFKTKPLYYVFDILLMKDKKITDTYISRYNLLQGLDLASFVIPNNTRDIREEYNNLLNKKSGMIDDFAKQANVSTSIAYEVCEGFVIKRCEGILKYPMNVSHNPNQLKLKLPGR